MPNNKLNADVIVNFSTFSTIWQFTPISDDATEFFENDCGFEDWQKLNGTYAVDHRPARDFAHFLTNYGFTVVHPAHGVFVGGIDG